MTRVLTEADALADLNGTPRPGDLPLLPEPVIAWMNAESARIAAVHEYNAAHEAAKKYDFGAVDLNPHFQRMTQKANAAHRLLAPMHAALVAYATTYGQACAARSAARVAELERAVTDLLYCCHIGDVTGTLVDNARSTLKGQP